MEEPRRERLRGSRSLASRFPRLFSTYFTFDRRSLGLCRIYLGCLLLWDLFRRLPGLSAWYTNDGLLPNHVHLWRPATPYMFSLLFAASTRGEALVMFAFAGLAFGSLLIGYKTKLAHILSFVGLLSLHNRCVFLENGGDVVLNILCAWTLFLPMGDRFSVDAVLESLRRCRETSFEELNDRRTLPKSREPAVSIAVLAVLLQVSVIYYFNSISKTGQTWRRGSAVHYVLYQERMVTWFGYLVRDYVSPTLSLIMAKATLIIEAAAPILLLTPYARTILRRTAIAVVPGMHLAFAAFINVGMFSFNMMGYFPLLLGAADWELLRRWLGPSLDRARIVYFDERSAIWFFVARLLRRLDPLGLLRFASSSDRACQFEVEQIVSGHRASGIDALAECLAALPGGLLLSGWMRAPLMRGACLWMGGAIASRAAQIERRFGLVPMGELAAFEPGPSPIRRWLGRAAAGAREVAVIVVMVALTSQLLMENKVIPKRLKLGQASWMTQIVLYPRLYQGWSMFTPDAPTSERMLYVDAVTFDGRHVDPFNEAASRVATLPVERIPAHLGQDEFWCDYTNRIADSSVNWLPLKEWLFRYHERTGRPQDRVISYEARILESDSPPPGETQARNFRTRVIAREHE